MPLAIFEFFLLISVVTASGDGCFNGAALITLLSSGWMLHQITMNSYAKHHCGWPAWAHCSHANLTFRKLCISMGLRKWWRMAYSKTVCVHWAMNTIESPTVQYISHRNNIRCQTFDHLFIESIIINLLVCTFCRIKLSTVSARERCYVAKNKLKTTLIGFWLIKSPTMIFFERAKKREWKMSRFQPHQPDQLISLSCYHFQF